MRGLVFGYHAFRWIGAIVTILIVIAIGEALPPLRRFDEWIAPHRFRLQLLFWILLTIGFVMFMSGTIHLAVRSRSRADGQFTFVEIARAWRNGTWRATTRMRRFFLIAAGAIVGTLAGTALVVVTASPGIKLVMMLAAGYAIVRTVRAWLRLQ